MVLHPDSVPDLETWTNRPPVEVLGRWGNGAGCVAISRNCVITTLHQGGSINTSVEIGGGKYDISQIWDHQTADLRIAKLSSANLEHFVNIFRQRNEFGKNVVIGGYGVGAGNALQKQGQTYGYQWADYSSRALRMGANKIEQLKNANTLENFTSDIIIADFDGPGEGGSTVYETIPATLDSGGGWFIKQSGSWKLAGLTRAVEVHYEQGHDNDPNFMVQESWFRNRDNPALPQADQCDAVRISSYAGWILATIPDVPPGDLNGDDFVNFADLAVLSHFWLHADCQGVNPCLGADFESDGDVDSYDLIEFSSHWLDSQ